MKVWMLTNEDIVMAAGGPMGSPVEVRWTRLFSTVKGAKLFAQRGHPDKKLLWTKMSTGSYSSQDMGDTMYTISSEKVLT